MMIKRFFPIFSIILLLISLVAPGIQPVAAAGEKDKGYEDGEYNVIAKALHADKEESSGAASFIDEAAKILIEDGQIKFVVSIPNNDMAEITGLQVEGIDPVKEEKDDSVIYTYALNELKEELNAQVQYEVESLSIEHDMPLRFKLEGINEISVQEDDHAEAESEGNKEPVEEPEDTDESEDNEGTEDNDKAENTESTEEEDESQDNEGSEAGEEPSDNQESTDGDILGDDAKPNNDSAVQQVYEDGNFKIDYSVDVDTMNDYMEKPAQLIIDEGKNEVTIRFKSQKFIDKFEVEIDGKLVEAKRQAVDDNFVDYVFEVHHLDVPLHSKITINAMGEVMEHEFNISFDTSNLKEVKLDPNNLADGTYSINQEILHDTKDETSNAAGYIVNPAQLSVEHGVKTVYFTITDHEAIKDFKIEQNGTLSSVKTVEVNEQKNTRLVAFEVEDLDAVLRGQFKIYIPAMNYDAEPFARITFDTDSIKKSDGKLPDVPTKPELKEGGAYTINLRVLEPDKFEKSPIGNYINMPVDLTLQNGKNVVYLTLLNSKKVKDIKIETKTKTNNVTLFNTSNLTKVSGDNFESAQVVKENQDENTRIISFDIDDLDGKVNALVTMDVDGKDTEYPVRLFFEENSVRASDGLPNLEPEKPTGPTGPTSSTLDPTNLEEGYYKLDYTFFKDGEDAVSSMDNFTDGPAYVKVDEKGNKYVAMTFTSANMIGDFKVDSKIAKVLQEDQKAKTKVVEFTVDDLTKKQSGSVYVEVPGMYATEHKVDLVFDTNTLEEIQEDVYPEDQNVQPDPEESEKPEEETPTSPEKPSEPLDPKKLKEGYYELDYTFFKKGEDVPSSMDNFTDGPAYVKVDEKGNKYVAMTFTSADMIKYFKVNDKTAKVLQEDQKAKTKVVEFAVEDLTKKQPGSVYVEVPGMYATEHDVDLVFDTDTLVKSSKEKYPGDEGDGKEPGKPATPGTKDTFKTLINPDVDPKNLLAGEYTIDYTFLEKGSNQISMMDGFTEGPAYVKVDQKGNQRVAITFTGADYIKGFKVNGKSAKVLQVDTEQDTMVVEFPVEDLTQKQAAWVAVDVPGVYNTAHDVDLVFNVNTLDLTKAYPSDDKPTKELQQSDDSSSHENGDNLNFDRDEDGNLLVNNDTSGANPKTADLNMTQIMLFGSLLLLSMIPLAIKLRRKFVTSK